MSDEVTILGIGSTLMGDDGIGVRAAEALSNRELGEGVRVIASGLIGMDLIYELEDLEAAVIIDAAEFGGEPGEIKVASPEEIDGLSIERLGAAHSIGLAEVLAMLAMTGSVVAIRLVCVQPADVSPRDGLSELLEGRVEAVADAALAEARGLLDASAR